MERSKVKNIVLLILLITNLFLLVFMVRQEWRVRRAEELARESALGFLADRGVQVEPSAIPHRMDLRPQIVERDREGESKAAQALLKGTVVMEPRGGEVYRYYNENGTVQFHSDGTFSAELTPGAYPLAEDRDSAVLALLKTLSFEGEEMAWPQDGVTVRQNWQGAPLFSQRVTVQWTDGAVTALSGRRLMGQPEEDPGRSTLTVASALIHFFNGLNGLGDVCSRVDGITQGYVSAVSLNAPGVLTPVWWITTDTGAYQLDLVTGELTRLG